MVQLTPQQEKRLGKIVKVIEDGNLAIAHYIFELEDQFQQSVEKIQSDFDTKVKELKASVPDLNNVLEQVKGKPGEKGDMPVAGVDYPLPENGKDGETYILTEQDKKDIARSIKVPIVEKIIEKTDIIHEQPILKTEIVKETIKEIVKNDEVARTEIEILKTELGTVKSEMSRIPRGTIGGSRPMTVMDDGVQIGGAVNELNFTGGTLTTTGVSGRRVNIPVGGGGGFTALTATGTIDNSNVTFTFTSHPTYLVVNGIWRKVNEGWTGAGTTITLSAPVGVGGAIWGIS